MNRLLIHHARPLSSRVRKLELDPALPLTQSEDTLHEVEHVLRRLGEIHPELRAVVECKVFEGLSEGEIALRLDFARRTVARRWSFAKHLLQNEYAVQEA